LNFDFSEDQKLLQRTARDYLVENSPLALCRKVFEAGEPYSRELWSGAAELGWLGAVIPEAHGGAGFGHLELALLAHEVGRALAPIPFGSSVYLATEALLLLGSDAQRAERLPRLAAGTEIGCWAVEESAGTAPTRFENGALRGEKQPVLDGASAHFAIVSAQSKEGPVLALAPLAHASVARQPLGSIDPSRPQAALRFAGTPAQLLGAAGSGTEQSARVIDHAAVLLAFEQLGLAERAFEITTEYALERHAFGRPVASFQAIKHRLADLYCELELARSNAYYGAWALSQQTPELRAAASIARVSASAAAELAVREMIQIHGGIGFTWESDCHLFYRRAKLLGLVLGSLDGWRERIARELWTQAD
jgi:alkylation response protein AidB-like acyl-CoA dehydrogenase